MKLKNTVREFAVITFAMLIVSAAVYFFMVPSKIVMGSISGLALVFSQLTGISMSILTFFLNAILLVIGFLLIGKDFGAKTIYTSILLPIFLWIFERLIPVTESVTGNQVFEQENKSKSIPHTEIGFFIQDFHRRIFQKVGIFLHKPVNQFLIPFDVRAVVRKHIDSAQFKMCL